jgi:hypothetical protein
VDACSHRRLGISHAVDVIGPERLPVRADQTLLVQSVTPASGARFVKGTPNHMERTGGASMVMQDQAAVGRPVNKPELEVCRAVEQLVPALQQPQVGGLCPRFHKPGVPLRQGKEPPGWPGRRSPTAAPPGPDCASRASIAIGAPGWHCTSVDIKHYYQFDRIDGFSQAYTKDRFLGCPVVMATTFRAATRTGSVRTGKIS